MTYMTARLYTDDVLQHTPGSWQAFASCSAGDPCALFKCGQESPSSSVAPASSTCIRCIRGVFGTDVVEHHHLRQQSFDHDHQFHRNFTKLHIPHSIGQQHNYAWAMEHESGDIIRSLLELGRHTVLLF
ncbi:hypothetical protein WJX79_000747 [Trebouxia sp. C0005]